MLKQILNEIEQATEPLTVPELSRRLHLEPGVVSQMVAFWVHKGRLSGDNIENTPHLQHCGRGCHGPDNCHFVAKMPGAYTLRKR